MERFIRIENNGGTTNMHSDDNRSAGRTSCER